MNNCIKCVIEYLFCEDIWMNKKLFLKLGLLLLSLLLVACGQENNLAVEEESIKTTSVSDENAVEKKQEDEDVQKNIQQGAQQDIEENTQQEAIEDEYYIIIKEAWQKQKDYIDSIDDTKEKQSLQTSQSAAIMESNRLLIEHPEDSEAIEASLKKVINGE